MSRKPAAKKARRRAPEPEPVGDGILARMIDRTFENPAMSGGLLVMALTATAIVSNAMFLQRGEHPDPLFMTRGTETRNADASGDVPAGRAAVARADRVIDAPPSPRLSPTHTASIPTVEDIVREPAVVAAVQPEPQPMPAPPVPPEPIASEASPAVILLTAIQRELARLGLYSGAIDGLMGQRTASAIAAFETASGMKVTGQPSATLLKAIKQPTAAAVAAAVPTQAVALSDPQAEELDRRERKRARLIAEREQSVERSRGSANTRIVQAALNRIGYGPLPVDGAGEGDTEEAIRRFELDNGMPVTGTASDALITRLIAIGAVKPG